MSATKPVLVPFEDKRTELDKAISTWKEARERKLLHLNGLDKAKQDEADAWQALTSIRCGLVKASQLSPREYQVYQFLTKGVSNKEIAEKLFISVRTVKFHTSIIMHKLGVVSRQQLVNI